jgi:hypothetical protein
MCSYKKITSFLFLVVLTWIQLPAQDHFEVKRLSFNTSGKELAPAFYQNGIVFCSDRKNEVLTSYTDLNRDLFTNLYQAEQKKPGKFEHPRLMSKELTTFLFEGPATFSRDGKTVYFTRSINVSMSSRNRNRADTTFGIFSSTWSGGAWSNLTQFRFNRPDYNTGFPSLSDDGTMLFFCSDAPGGSGGYDIYVSKLENGRWGPPENLGNNINTAKNEVFPFLHASRRLYFASRGLNQRGDLDIYYTVNIDNEWQKPVPMTAPFNSTRDDYGLILNTAADTGYFVSDRSGSPDILSAYSTIPTFSHCPDQQENDYCYVFYEPNNNEVDTTAFAYEWDLGDGTIIRALEAEHCFAKPDTYLVKLNIIDKLTKELMANQAEYKFVVAKIEQAYIKGPETVALGQEIALDGNETYLKDFTVDNYYWDFGDGFRASGSETKHSFAYPGTYSLTLGVTDKKDSKDEPDRTSCITRKIIVIKPQK